MAKTLKDNIVSLFETREVDLPEVVLDTSHMRRPSDLPQPMGMGLDLTGRPKVIMAIGAGSTGKTTLLRLVIEEALARDDGNPMALASVDPVNRELRHYFPQAMGPKSHDPAQTAAWLEKFLSRVMATQKTAAIDFGGGDSSLASLLGQMPDLQGMMERSGIEPVALYLLSPRVSDLTPLAAMETGGFRPKATALVLNMGRILADRDPEQEFAQLRKHSAYRAAVERGAVQIWMPRLYAAKAVEDRRVGFRQAAGLDDAAPLAQPMDIFAVHQVRSWLEQMTASFAPIQSWLA